MKKIYFYFLFPLYFGVASAQVMPLDSLKTVLAKYDARHKGPVSLKDSVKVKLLHQLVQVANYVEPDLALEYARQQLALSKKIGYSQGELMAYNALGYVYDGMGDFASALKHYKLLMSESLKRKDKFYELAAANNISSLYGERSDFNEAIRYALLTLKLSKELGDDHGTASAYNNLGVLHRQTGDLVQALKDHQSALKVAQRVKKGTASLPIIYSNIGQIYSMQGQPEKAFPYLEKGLAVSRDIQDMASVYRALNTIGNLYLSTNQLDKARDAYAEALQIAKQGGNAQAVATGYLNLGRVEYLRSEFQTALEYAKKTESMIKGSGDLDLEVNTHDLLAKIYEETKDYKQAYGHHVLFKQMADSMFNVEKNETFSRLKLKYDLATAQDSLSDIQVKKDLIASEAIKTQRNTRNFVIIVAVLVVTFLVIVIWQRNKIAKIKRQKALEQERNRISRDLHDNLGTQLSTVRMFVSNIKNTQDAKASEMVDNSIGLLDSSISELRSIMNQMHNPELTESGYLKASEELINSVNRLHSVKFSLSHHNMDERPDPEIEHHLFRITQELINNTLKYAKASHVSIDVLRRNGKLVLMYEDDGVGFNPGAAKKGYGLDNIKARVENLGGTVDFDSTPGSGARTTVEIPESNG